MLTPLGKVPVDDTASFVNTAGTASRLHSSTVKEFNLTVRMRRRELRGAHREMVDMFL